MKFTKPFSAVSDGKRYFVVAQVDEKTAKRAAAMLNDETPEALAAVVANALNLHAMPRLIAGAGLASREPNSQSVPRP